MSISNYSFNSNGLFSSISQNTWSISGGRLNFDSISYDLFGSTNTHYDFSLSGVFGSVVGGVALAIPSAMTSFTAAIPAAAVTIDVMANALFMGALGGVAGLAVGAFAGYVIADAVVDYITTDKYSVNTNEFAHAHESFHAHEGSASDISTLAIGAYFLIGCCTALVDSLDDAIVG